MPNLRFAIRVGIYVTSGEPGEPNLTGDFVQTNSRIEYRLVGNPVVEVPDLPKHQRYVKYCNRLEFIIHDIQQMNFASMIGASEWSRLMDALVHLANRALVGIRNFGTVPHVSELKVRSDTSGIEQELRRWELSMTDSSGNFQRVFPEAGPFGDISLLFGTSGETHDGEMDAYRWPDIVEAIQSNLQPGPEHEFYTNALEHLRLGNYRYSLLEAVICLEIVVSQFIRANLHQRGMSGTRVDKFMSDLGLTARIAAVLDLTLERPFDTEYIQTALRAIEWRNEVVHKTGRLPVRPESEIRGGIATLLGIAYALAQTRDELHAAPAMRDIAQQLGAMTGTTVGRLFPVLKARGQHRVFVDFTYLVPSSVPSEGEMQGLVDTTTALLAARDPGFDKARHLLVRFMVLPNDVRARWVGGGLVVTPTG